MKTYLPALGILCGLLNANYSALAQDWSLTTVPEALWTGVACSADGMKLVTVGYASGIFVSTNRGKTWAATSASLDPRWSAVASSADGTKLVAVVQDLYGAIYTSTNSGTTWKQTSAPTDDYRSIASSPDGTKLVAGSHFTFILRPIPGQLGFKPQPLLILVRGGIRSPFRPTGPSW